MLASVISHLSFMASVIGTKFTLDLACTTHGTEIGMLAGVTKYEKNTTRSPARMEAEIMVWKSEDESHAIEAAA